MSTKKQEPTNKTPLVIGAIFSGLAMLVVLWTTFYLNQVLACNTSFFDQLRTETAPCQTRWAFVPLWITGIIFFTIFGAAFLKSIELAIE